MSKLYLTLALLGTFLSYGAFVPWLINHGLNIPFMLSQATVNPISVFAWLDVVIAAITLLAFILVDGKNNHVKHRVWAVIGTLAVGVSCGLPLYLYFKEVSKRT